MSNLLRLPELPEAIKRLLDEGKLEMGHARCLLTLAEGIARAAGAPGRRPWAGRCASWRKPRAARRPRRRARQKARPPRDPNIAALERELAERFATRVELAQGRGGRGKLVIHYHSIDELDGILTKIR